MRHSRNKPQLGKNASRDVQLEQLENRHLLSADGLPAFDGSAVLYQIHGNSDSQGQLSAIDVANGAFVDLGDRAGFTINGIGYRNADDLIYGMEMSNDHLIRLGADGSFERLGAIEGLPNGSYYTGDFGHDGLLYVRHSNTFYGIDVDQVKVERTINTTSSVSGIADVAYNPETELFYSVRRQGGTTKTADFISIDLREGADLGTVTVISNSLSPGGTYGAVFSDANGRVFAANNAGGLYEINVESGEATFAGKTPRASSNDGAAPAEAAVNLPPVASDSFVSVLEGATDVSLRLAAPVDLEDDPMSIMVVELPTLGTVHTSTGEVQVGDTLSMDEFNGLLYDAPDTYDDNSDPGDFVYSVSDGSSEVEGRSDILLSGMSRIAGQVLVIDDSNFGEYEGYVFNNEIRLNGTDFEGRRVSQTVLSDFHGNFAFDEVLPGTYSIEQVQAGGVLDGFASSGDGGSVTSSNLIENINIPMFPAGEFGGFQFVDYAPSSLSGFVFVDENFDGEIGVTEEGVSKVTIQLSGVDDVGNFVDQATTSDTFGFYEFENPRPGTYSLTQTQPDGYTTFSELVGSVGGLTTENEISQIELGAGTSGQGYSLGEIESARISGTVYIDQDIDRALDEGDTGIAGNTIRLVGTDYEGVAVDRTQVTDVNGNYSFDHLLPGTYSVIQTEQPQGLLDGKENLGSFSNMGTNLARNGVVGDDVISSIEILPGECALGNNFGERLELLLTTEFDETIVLEATEEADIIDVVIGTDFHTVTINGESTQLAADRVVDLYIDALAGDDTVTMTGTNDAEEVVMHKGQTTFHGHFWRVQITAAEDVTVYGNGGYDLAHLHGTEGNERVKATESYLRMIGEGDSFLNKAYGFHRAKAYAGGGDDDRAYFYDSSKDDTMKLTEDNTRMFSRKFYNAALDFDRVYSYAINGGDDHARFWDSAADEDLFEAKPDFARMWNTDFYNAAEGFENVVANAVYGGENDRAYLYDSEGDDILVSSPRESGISGEGFEYTIQQFERTYAYASEGNDRAYLFDSKLDDRFLAYSDNVRLYNDDYYLRADDFDHVDAYSSKGGSDRAYFYDSEGDDTVVALENEVRMYSVASTRNYNNVSHGFARAYLEASSGGYDVARLFDTDGADTLKTSSTNTRMYGAGYYTRAESNFEAIEVIFSEASPRDRAMVFGVVDQSTLDAAGGLGSVISDFGADYVHSADGIFADSGSDSDDDDGSSFADMLPATDLYELPSA